MITQKNIKIKIVEVEALTTKAYIDKSATYDKQKGELTFTANEAKDKAFRLIHDDKKAFVVDGTDGTVTISIFNIEEFGTKEEVLNRIKVLGLEYTPEVPKENLETKGQIKGQTNKF